MQHQPETYRPATVRQTATNTLQNLAIQDVVALCFHTYMLLRAFVSPESTDRTFALRFAIALFSATAASLLLTRGELLKPGKLRSVIYRLGLMAPIVISYFEMRFLLPALQPVLMDERLHAIDRALFGVTPAVWFAQFNQRNIVEWVSFFYYSYFPIMILCLIPSLFLDKGRRQIELFMGACIVATCGHFIYTLVPGVGPVHTLDFEPLEGGFWWEQVSITVASAGSQYDIFPSLHTAYPTFFALHAFGWRKTQPYKYTWFILAFFAANIWIATMFLRWHWFIDVVAGLCLAFSARAIGVAVAQREEFRGQDPDDVRQPTWEPLFGRSASDEAAGTAR